MASQLQITSWMAIENLILRPPRCQYSLEDLLGGEDGDFTVTGPNNETIRCFRMDIELKNGRGERLIASQFLPSELWKREHALPVVVYCHGNAGGRIDANPAAYALLRRGISVFAFDFAGSGLSDGDIVTLGARECADLDVCIKFLRAQGRTSHIALWGRSMGAVTAALYARTNLSIAGVVLDSPFAKLTELMRDIVSRDISSDAPSLLVSAAIMALRSSIKRRTGVDINSLDAVAAAKDCFQPALIIHALSDELIYPAHAKQVEAAWAGDVRLMLLKERQGHNTTRPKHVLASAVTFLCAVLSPGLKDAEQIFKNGAGCHIPLKCPSHIQNVVGFGEPPPPTPRAVDSRSARMATLFAVATSEEEAPRAERAGPSSSTDDDDDDEEAGGASESEDDWERAAAAGAAEVAARLKTSGFGHKEAAAGGGGIAAQPRTRLL